MSIFQFFENSFTFECNYRSVCHLFENSSGDKYKLIMLAYNLCLFVDYLCISY